MSKVRYICKICGSAEDIRFDAWAYWDEDLQQMELDATFDNTYCVNCEGEASVEEVKIKE